MKITHSQLAAHLLKALSPFYLVTSDEIFLQEEAAKSINAIAKSKGFTEHTLIIPETEHWGEKFFEATRNMSLFSEKKIVEINLQQQKLTAAQGKFLIEYAEHPNKNILVIVRAPKLDQKIEKSAWFKTLEKVSIVLTIWPLTAAQFPAFLLTQAKKYQLKMTARAAEYLASLVEGNLLAAAQEIEKLSLLNIEDTLDVNHVQELVTDHTHYDIFNLVDAALIGIKTRCQHILAALKKEVTEPTLILWALTREIRTLTEIMQQCEKGDALSALLDQYRYWGKRQAAAIAFVERHSIENCWKLLLYAANVDRCIKGIETENPWNNLEILTMKIAGTSYEYST